MTRTPETMTDDELEFLIVQRVDGTLSRDEAALLDRVLAERPEARRLLSQHERLAASLQAATVPAIDAEWLSAQIAAQIDDAEAASSYRMPRVALWAPMAAAAALLITLTLGVLYHRDDGEPIAVQQPVQASPETSMPVAFARVSLPGPTPTASQQDRRMSVSVGAPANVSTQMVTALFLAEQFPGSGRVHVSPAGPQASAFE